MDIAKQCRGLEQEVLALTKVREQLNSEVQKLGGQIERMNE